MSTITSARGAQTISRAITVLKAVARTNDTGSRLSEVASRAGLKTSTAHRILSVLAAEGLISHDEKSKLYYLGFELYSLGNQAQQFALCNRFHATLEDIEKQTQNTVFLVIRSGYDAICVDRVEGSHPVRTVPVNVGDHRPLGIGAGSLALLAFLPPAERKAIVTANAPRYFKFNGMGPENIYALAAKARQLGYVSSKGLFHAKIHSVSLPIFDGGKVPIAAITVSTIKERMGKEIQGSTAELIRRAVLAHGVASCRAGD